MNQITIEQLMPFCSVDETWKVLARPFSDDKFTYATDGKILIFVPKAEPETPWTDELKKIILLCQNKANLKCFDGTYRTLPIDDGTWGLKCDQCDGSKSVTQLTCDCCGEVTKLNTTILCPECFGEGKTFSNYGIRFGKQILSAYYLRKLALFQEVEIAEAKEPIGCLSIRFSGGWGRLMPMNFC